VQGIQVQSPKLSLTVVLDCQTNELQNSLLNNYAEKLVTVPSSGAACVLNLALANVFDVGLSTNCTFSFTNAAASGKAGSFTLLLRNSTGKTVTWPAAVKWSEAAAPRIGGVSIFSFVSVDGGATWYGFPGGSNFA